VASQVPVRDAAPGHASRGAVWIMRPGDRAEPRCKHENARINLTRHGYKTWTGVSCYPA
jgi:hypothetical protein